MPTTDLMSALTIDSVTFMPQFRQEFSRQAGGTPRVADLGPELWMAKISASKLSNKVARNAAALIHKMGCSLDTFYAWDPRAQYPQEDPSGAILGSSAVTIYALNTDTTLIRLEGLPVGYRITRGDKFSWDQGSPAHRCLHEFSDSVVADGAGRIALTKIFPAIRAGATTGLEVSLKRPAAEMMIMPGSYDFPSSGTTISTISFTAIQIP